MSDQERVYPAPNVNVEIRAYFDAATEGKLLLKTCETCGQNHFYPRALCPFCFSEKTKWIESSGKGVIYSYSVMRAAEPNYVLAYVELEEGVRVLTNIVDCDVDTLNIGQDVKVAFVPSKDGQVIPVFTPV